MEPKIEFDAEAGVIKTTSTSTGESAGVSRTTTTVETKDAAHYIAELEDRVKLHTDNIVQLQQQKMDDAIRIDAQVATEKAALDEAKSKLDTASTTFKLTPTP